MSTSSKIQSVWRWAVALLACSATTQALLKTTPAAWSATDSAPAAATLSGGTRSPSLRTWWGNRWPFSWQSKSRTGPGLRPNSCDSLRWSVPLVDLPAWLGQWTRPAPSLTAEPDFKLRQPTFTNCPAPAHWAGQPASPAMATLTPQQCLQRLRCLYRDAMRCSPASDEAVLRWAKQPEHWATQQIQHRNWTYTAAEGVVRACRIFRKRAALALGPQGTSIDLKELQGTSAAIAQEADA